MPFMAIIICSFADPRLVIRQETSAIYGRKSENNALCLSIEVTRREALA